MLLNTTKGPPECGCGSSIAFLPSDQHYYVQGGGAGNKMWLTRSKDLATWEEPRRDESYPFIQPSVADARVAPYCNASANAAVADPTGARGTAPQWWDIDSNDGDWCCESWGDARPKPPVDAFTIWGCSSQGQPPAGGPNTTKVTFTGLTQTLGQL